MKTSTRFRMVAYPIAIAATIVVYFHSAVEGAIIASPVLPWELSDPNTTYQQYTFSTDSQNPAPEEVINPYGVPEMEIVFVPSGGVGTGWQDPDPNVFSINREEGAWDLGPEGFITVDVPIGLPLPSPAHYYLVEVFVGVVYEPTAGFFNLPELIFDPSTVITTTVQPQWEVDGFFFWGLLTGSGTAEVASEWIRILVDSTGTTGSLIDTIEVHTRYTLIPEPRYYAAVLGLLALLAVGRRRRRS